MDNLLDLTSRVEATHFWFRGFRQFVAPAISEIAGPRRDLHLLDCGCGTGHNLATLLRPYAGAFGHGGDSVSVEPLRSRDVVRRHAVRAGRLRGRPRDGARAEAGRRARRD